MSADGRVPRRIHPRAWATLSIGGAWLLFNARMIFSSRVPYERDILMTALPLRQYAAERLRSGHLPQWYPYELFGVPFAGSLVASPFHPQMLLFLLLKPAVALKWSLLLGSLFGLAGAYRLARELRASRPAAVAGAFAFGFGGYAVSLASNPPFLVPLVTMPWVLAAAHRVARRDDWRDVAALAWWWGLVLLGGDAQSFLECGVLGLAILIATGLRRRSALGFAAATGLAAGLVAVEVLPALAVEDESIRATWQPSAGLASIWALNPLRLLDFAVPRLVPIDQRLEFGRVFEGQLDLFASTLFVGGVVLLLATIALVRETRTALLWFGLAIIGVVLALGHTGGVLELLWKIAPPLGRLRFPEKYVGIAAVSLTPLVALGVDSTLRSPRRIAVIGLAAGSVVLLAGVFVPPPTFGGVAKAWILEHATISPELTLALGAHLRDGLIRTGAWMLALGGGLYFLENAGQMAVLIPAAILGELWFGNAGRTPLASNALVDDPGEFARILTRLTQDEEPPPRVVPAQGGSRGKEVPDDDLVRRIHLWLMPDDSGRGHVVSFDENSSAERERTMSLLFGRDAPTPSVWWPRFNVCYRVADWRHPARAGEDVVFSDPESATKLVRVTCRPRAWLANAVHAETRAEARQAMRDLPEDAIVWEGGPALSGAGGTTHWLAAEPERLRLDVDSTAPSALFISEAYARGWTATVDGRTADIYPADVAGRGISVPAGHHTVEMRYEAPLFWTGLMVTLLASLGTLALAFAPGWQPALRVLRRTEAA
jgi:hypothetical protein